MHSCCPTVHAESGAIFSPEKKLLLGARGSRYHHTFIVPLTMTTAPLLEVSNVAVYKAEGQPIISHVNFTVNQGDVVVIRGQSGSGKTTMLKCLAHLDLYSGNVIYRGKSPQAHGIPAYRTEVMYIPQRPSLLPLTPRDFVSTVMSFYSRRRGRGSKGEPLDSTLNSTMKDIIQTGEKLGISDDLWDRNWADLSGGEGQRIMLTIGTSLGTAEILLFDEPTSALDPQSTLAVEKTILQQLRAPESKLKAIVWITHSEEQARRVGSRFITIGGGTCHEDPIPPV